MEIHIIPVNSFWCAEMTKSWLRFNWCDRHGLTLCWQLNIALFHRCERQIKELKAELAMRDTLTGRGQVNYNDLSDAEAADLKALVRHFLEGNATVDQLPCDTLKQVKEAYKQMQLAYQAAKTVSTAIAQQQLLCCVLLLLLLLCFYSLLVLLALCTQCCCSCIQAKRCDSRTEHSLANWLSLAFAHSTV